MKHDRRSRPQKEEEHGRRRSQKERTSRRGGNTEERLQTRETGRPGVIMEEDIRKQGILHLQQQRFGKVRTELAVKLMLMNLSKTQDSCLFPAFKLTSLHYRLFFIETDLRQVLNHIYDTLVKKNHLLFRFYEFIYILSILDLSSKYRMKHLQHFVSSDLFNTSELINTHYSNEYLTVSIIFTLLYV